MDEPRAYAARLFQDNLDKLSFVRGLDEKHRQYGRSLLTYLYGDAADSLEHSSFEEYKEQLLASAGEADREAAEALVHNDAYATCYGLVWASSKRVVDEVLAMCR